MLDCDLVFKSDYGVFMSVEILQEINDKFDECYEGNLKPSFEWMVGISEKLRKALVHQDIKPVAWALFSKDIMPSGVAFAIRRVEIDLAQIEADLDIQDAVIKPLYLKGDLMKSDQSDRVSELEKHIVMLKNSSVEADKRIRELKNESKSWKVLYEDECASYDAKIQSLALKIESLTDANIDRVLTMTDDQITALTVMDGHNPDDVAKIGRHAAETAILKSKIKSLEYQIKQLSTLHSATVNALADERSKPGVSNA